MPVLSSTAVLVLSGAVRWYLSSQTDAAGAAGGAAGAEDSALSWLSDMVGGVASNAAHEELKTLLARVEDGSIDPVTRLPRNHDLQNAGADALQGAVRALVWKLAERVQLEQPWRDDLQAWLKQGRVRRFFSESAVAGVPARAWVAHLHARLAEPGALRELHAGLRLDDTRLRAVVRGGHAALSGLLSEAVLGWVRGEGGEGELGDFEEMVRNGWTISGGGQVGVADLYALFFAEFVKNRPSVFRILMTGELAEQRALLERLAGDLQAGMGELRGLAAGLAHLAACFDRGQKDLAMRLDRQQAEHAELTDQLIGILPWLFTLSQAAAAGRADAAEALRRLPGIEAKLDYLIGGIPLLRYKAPPPPAQELDLLKPQYRVLPLRGREGDLAGLRSWLGGPAPVSARLVVGRAGSGKTRLGLELLREMAEYWPHWQAGHLRREDLHKLAAKDLTQLTWNAPTLLLVDYAQIAAEPLGQVLAAAVVAAQGRENVPPLRVLLLEREPGAWFETLLRQGEASSYAPCALRAIFIPAEPVPVTPIGDLALRRELLAEALRRAEAFRQRAAHTLPPVPAPGRDAAFDRLLAAEPYAEPLQLALAALVALDPGMTLTTALQCPRARLARAVAEHERTRLRRFAAPPGQGDTASPARERLFLHLAACATVERGFSPGELTLAVAEESAALRLNWAEGEGALAERLGEALPHPMLPVAPIEPDFVGEAFMLLVLAPAEPTPRADQWAAWVAVLERCGGRDTRATATTVFHAWQNFHEDALAKERLLHAIDSLVAVAGQAGGEALLLSLAQTMPERTVDLRGRALVLRELLYERAKRDAVAHPGEEAQGRKAAYATELSACLSEVGRREEALKVATEAAELYRELARKAPDAFTADLANSLNNLAKRWRGAGRRDEALAVAREAADLYRRLAGNPPDVFTADLAKSLNSLANSLSDSGRREEAMTVATEAVELYRGLERNNPDTFTPALATSLLVQANSLSGLGRREDALSLTREAVELYRGLARKNPDAFVPALAAALNNLAIDLSNIGRAEESLMVARETAKLNHGLAKKNPDAFTPDLAQSLNCLSACLREAGLRDESLEVVAEAVQLRRKLVQKNPTAFTPSLATSLNNQAVFLSEEGRRDEALAVGSEAAELRRVLAKQNPDAFTPALARSLNNLALYLGEMGQREEAFVVAKEATELNRGLAQKTPEALIPDLAKSLQTLAKSLNGIGRWEDALMVAKEAAELNRGLAQKIPDAFTPELALSFDVLAKSLSGTGRKKEALAVAKEAVELNRGLARKTPNVFNVSLAISLEILAKNLSEMDEREEALTVAAEAVELSRGLVWKPTSAFTPALARSLFVLGERLGSLGRHAGAAAVHKEAISLLRPYWQALPQAHGELFVFIIRDYLAACAQAGQELEAELMALARELGLVPSEGGKPTEGPGS